MRPVWKVGVVPKGPEFDAGFRWVVIEELRGETRLVAYTKSEDDAERIADALNKVSASK